MCLCFIVVFVTLQLCEMYTNRAYETFSELDNVSGDSSANSGHNRLVASSERDFNENLSSTHVASKQSINKQMKYFSKHIPSAHDDDQKRHIGYHNSSSSSPHHRNHKHSKKSK